MAETLYNAFHRKIELTNEQEACLNYKGNRTLVIKALAGGGKSLVLVKAAVKKAKENNFSCNHMVAFFTFQNTLVSSTKEIIKENVPDETCIFVSTVNSYIKQVYDELVKRGKAPKRSLPNIKSKNQDLDKRLKSVETALNRHREKYGKHRFHDFPYDFWLSEFDWMKDMNIGKDEIDSYIRYKRKGRGNKYRFSSGDYITAFQIYKIYIEHQEKAGLADWSDQPLFIAHNKDLIPEDCKFKYIFIDEAQDLSLAQMRALFNLCRDDGEVMIAMDANQKVHGKQWTPKLLGIESTTKKLTRSMRTTVKIDNLAESIRCHNDELLDEDDKGVRIIPSEPGEYMPKLVHFDDPNAERKYVVKTVETYIKEGTDLTIGIIASKNDQISKYSDWLTSENIDHEQITRDSTFSMKKPGVKIATAFGAKGLEFDIVIIPMFVEGCFPYSFRSDDEEEMREFLIKMRNLVYVAITRARQILIITWSGDNGSRFILEMNPEYYEFEGTPFIIKFTSTTSSASNMAKTDSAKSSASVKVPVYGSGKDSYSKTLSQGIVSRIDIGSSSEYNLVTFLEKKGLEVIDKRARNGSLWVIGGKELDPVLKETRREYKAYWTYCPKGGFASKYRPAWFTKCTK